MAWATLHSGSLALAILSGCRSSQRTDRSMTRAWGQFAAVTDEHDHLFTLLAFSGCSRFGIVPDVLHTFMKNPGPSLDW